MTKARDLANAGTALTSVSATELGYLDGVTSAVQTQINTKQATVSGVSDTEIGYLDGVTSAIQTQLDAKAVYPSQTGNSGKYLTTNGSTTSWGTVAAGGMTLLDTLTLSGSSVTSSTFSSSYNELRIYIRETYCGTNQQMNLRLNGDSSAKYAWTFVNDGTMAATGAASTYLRIGNIGTSSNPENRAHQIITLMRPQDSSTVFVSTTAQYTEGSVQNFDCTGTYDNSAAITSITLYIGTGSFSGGTAYIYGVN